MKRMIYAALLLFLISVSIWTMMMSVKGEKSSVLMLQTMKEDNIVRKNYVDKNGKITVALDKNYATVVQTYDGKNLILEEYLDDKGRRVTIPSGYSAIRREYDEKGQNTIITYLSKDGLPVKIRSGYSEIHRTYNERKKADTDTYFNNGEQIKRTQGYWGYKREYDEKGRIIRILYLDEEGNLTLNNNGYAFLQRVYNSKGKIESESFFDQNGNPATSTLGQFGYYREYDEQGRTTMTVYLDEYGQPMNIRKGYAYVRTTYEETGKKVRYYNVAGEPVTAGQYQFGVAYENGQRIYLDEDGETMIRLDNFLYNHREIVPVFGVLLTVAAIMIKGKKLSFLVVYLLFIGIMTLFYRETGATHAAFKLFRTYRSFFSNASIRQQILDNIWLFVPLGAVLYKKGSRQWVWPFLISAGIEAVQYFTGLGFCEIDDVISNSIGGLIGWIAATFWDMYLSSRKVEEYGEV